MTMQSQGVLTKYVVRRCFGWHALRDVAQSQKRAQVLRANPLKIGPALNHLAVGTNKGRQEGYFVDSLPGPKNPGLPVTQGLTLSVELVAAVAGRKIRHRVR